MSGQLKFSSIEGVDSYIGITTIIPLSEFLCFAPIHKDPLKTQNKSQEMVEESNIINESTMIDICRKVLKGSSNNEEVCLSHFFPSTTWKTVLKEFETINIDGAPQFSSILLDLLLSQPWKWIQLDSTNNSQLKFEVCNFFIICAQRGSTLKKLQNFDDLKTFVLSLELLSYFTEADAAVVEMEYAKAFSRIKLNA